MSRCRLVIEGWGLTIQANISRRDDDATPPDDDPLPLLLLLCPRRAADKVFTDR